MYICLYNAASTWKDVVETRKCAPGVQITPWTCVGRVMIYTEGILALFRTLLSGVAGAPQGAGVSDTAGLAITWEPAAFGMDVLLSCVSSCLCLCVLVRAGVCGVQF